jgi:hypothetical protein
VIGLIGFWPPLGIPAGIAGLMWFFAEKRWFDPSDLSQLKSEGRAAKELRDLAKERVLGFRNYRVRVPKLDAARLRDELDPLLVPLESGGLPDVAVLAATRKKLHLLTNSGGAATQVVEADGVPVTPRTTPQV